jgi:tryptophan-rich sensory protein
MEKRERRKANSSEGSWHDYITKYYIHFKHFKNTTMGNLLYVIALILVIAWAIGFFGYAAGGIIHLLLVIAIVLVLLKFIRREA